MEFDWVDGFEIKVTVDEYGSVVIAANEEGLLSLARHCESLSRQQPGDHIHQDEYNSLEKGSKERIIEKTEA